MGTTFGVLIRASIVLVGNGVSCLGLFLFESMSPDAYRESNTIPMRVSIPHKLIEALIHVLINFGAAICLIEIKSEANVRVRRIAPRQANPGTLGRLLEIPGLLEMLEQSERFVW